MTTPDSFPDKVGVPVLAPKLAVGHDRQPDLLLHPHDIADGSVLDVAEHRSIDFARLEIRARRMHR